MQIPDIESLRCFEAAATRSSFRAAADAVHLSPAAFSDRVKRLEELLGARLFERTTRRVALTAAGRRLLEPARRCLDEARRCVVAAGEHDRRAPFTLRLGTRFELGTSWLVPALGPLRERHLSRRIDLYFGDSPDLVERCRRGDVDAFISSVRLTEAALDYALLHEERYVFVATPALLADVPLAGPDHAHAHVLLDAHADLPLFRYFLDARPRSEVWAFAGQELLGAISAVRLRALASAGVAVLPRYFVDGDLAAGALVRLCPDTECERDFFRLVWRRGHPLEDELRALAEELRALPLR